MFGTTAQSPRSKRLEFGLLRYVDQAFDIEKMTSDSH